MAPDHARRSIDAADTRPAVTGPAHRRVRRRNGAEGNARLTGGTALLLLGLLAAEGFTILQIHRLLTLHVFIGMVLVGPILLKTASTLWRFVRYYAGTPAYRQKGPPPALLRLLGPFVVVLTFSVMATGIVLLVGPTSWRSPMLFLHKATFVLWFGAMAIHVLGHLADTARLAPRDWVRRSRRDVEGAGLRQWALAASLALGLVLAAWVTPHVGAWMVAGGFTTY